MSNQIIGTCSNCGGPVKMPTMMVDPRPCCTRCGATPKGPAYGPVIPMNPSNSANRPWFPNFRRGE